MPSLSLRSPRYNFSSRKKHSYFLSLPNGLLKLLCVCVSTMFLFPVQVDAGGFFFPAISLFFFFKYLTDSLSVGGIKVQHFYFALILNEGCSSQCFPINERFLSPKLP